MEKLLKDLLTSARQYNILDYSVFKTCLFSIGMMCGIIWSRTLRKFLPIICIISAISYAYLIYVTFIKYYRMDKHGN